MATTVLATIIILTAGLTISGYFFYFAATNGTAKDVPLVKFSYMGEFFGVVSYAIEGLGLLFPIRASLKSKKNYKSIYGSVYGVVVCFYFLLGFTGAVAYGKDLKEIVLLNFDDTITFIYPQALLYSFGIFVSIPYIIFPISVSLL